MNALPARTRPEAAEIDNATAKSGNDARRSRPMLMSAPPQPANRTAAAEECGMGDGR